MILDSNADQTKVAALLKKLGDRLEELQKQAFQYKTYQKNFKVSKNRLHTCRYHIYQLDLNNMFGHWLDNQTLLEIIHNAWAREKLTV